ncbi:hypothetical protein BHE74_00058620 [Ensete ventricosum]|nr:hypothetical protein BHE74_00058620 [Ensete ventricosum]
MLTSISASPRRLQVLVNPGRLRSRPVHAGFKSLPVHADFKSQPIHTDSASPVGFKSRLVMSTSISASQSASSPD